MPSQAAPSVRLVSDDITSESTTPGAAAGGDESARRLALREGSRTIFVRTNVLRVALDYRPALLTSSGIGRAVRELAAALAARAELEVHLYGHGLARARVLAAPDNARLHRLPVPGRSLPWLARIGMGADRLCGRPAVFHWTDYVQPPVNDATPVLTVHDLAFAEDETLHGRRQSRILLARTRLAASRAALILTPTQATARAVETHLGIETSRIRVIPFGADHVPAAKHGAHPLGGADYVLQVGTLEPRKNHLRLLRAWRQLPPPRPRLVVIGRPGWLCDDIVRALRGTHKEGVRWIPSADDATLWRYMAHARALVYPSLLEGFGFPPIEAMALGVPVLAADIAALREVLGEAAVFAAPTDIDALRDGLERVVGDEAQRRTCVAAGRVRARAYAWDECARAHAAAYRAACPGADA